PAACRQEAAATGRLKTASDDLFLQFTMEAAPRRGCLLLVMDRQNARMREEFEHGVRAQPQPQCFQRKDFFGADVAEVYVRAQLLDEPDLLGLLGRLEDDAILIDEVGDLLHQAGAHLAVRPVEPGRAAFACLADDLPTT